MVGRYKMGSRNATGTFEWTITQVLKAALLTEQAANSKLPESLQSLSATIFVVVTA